MNVRNNSTAAAGVATVTCPIPVAAIIGAADVLDRVNGLTSKSLAAKHLSALLLDFLVRKFGTGGGTPGPHEDCRTVIIHETQWLELEWLAAEVWESCMLADRLVGDLDEHLIEISNATYEARKAVVQ